MTYFFDFREQVRDNAIEQLEVFLQEFWDVGVSDGPQHNQLLHTPELVPKSYNTQCICTYAVYRTTCIYKYSAV